MSVKEECVSGRKWMNELVESCMSVERERIKY